MFDSKKIEEMSAKFSANFSEMMANSPVKDIEKNARAAMSGFFSRFDLVTREEFDIQVQVLARANQKIKALENRLAELEGRPKGSTSGTRNAATKTTDKSTIKSTGKAAASTAGKGSRAARATAKTSGASRASKKTSSSA